MVGIVIFTHGTLGQSFIEAVELIAGEQKNVAAIGLKHGDGVADFERKCRSAMAIADEGDGLLVFVDFLGGTPANTVLKCMREKPIHCIAGVNMPMLLEALTNRDQHCTAEELEALCAETGRTSIVRVASWLKKFDGSYVNDEI